MPNTDREKAIEENHCIESKSCGGKAEDFRDELSYEEYLHSGLCQKCQDEIFGDMGLEVDRIFND